MQNHSDNRSRVDALIAKGVDIPCPETVEIDVSIDPERIAEGVVLEAGSRIRGADTSIGPGCRIGQESPATIENCQLGKEVELKGGYFSESVFFDRAQMGSGAHVRAGTILEEEASGAHTVGLKQTLLLPFVTLGSLVNFCDVLMAGGTSRKNHSEVGSSYVHFNYTPHQDKATASLIGDVPRGVMLDQPPIFLGGQGGLVGPARIAYGCVIAAGAVYRRDALDAGMLVGAKPPTGSLAYNPDVYRSIRRILTNNFIYIGNMYALKAWYQQVRKPFMTDAFEARCCDGALRCLDIVLAERIRRLGQVAEKMKKSLEIGRAENDPALGTCFDEQERFMKMWPKIEAILRAGPQKDVGSENRNVFLAEWESFRGGDYLESIQKLKPDAKRNGTAWLGSVVDTIVEGCSAVL